MFVGLPVIGVNVSNGKLNFDVDMVEDRWRKCSTHDGKQPISIDDQFGEGTRQSFLTPGVEGLCSSIEVLVVQNGELHKL